jgi:hypothetical protein
MTKKLTSTVVLCHDYYPVPVLVLVLVLVPVVLLPAIRGTPVFSQRTEHEHERDVQFFFLMWCSVLQNPVRIFF